MNYRINLVFRVLLLGGIFTLNVQAKAPALSLPMVYHKCQGEGCGCAKSTKLQADVLLYAESIPTSRKRHSGVRRLTLDP